MTSSNGHRHEQQDGKARTSKPAATGRQHQSKENKKDPKKSTGHTIQRQKEGQKHMCIPSITTNLKHIPKTEFCLLHIQFVKKRKGLNRKARRHKVQDREAKLK
jgi:hypothetical protein